MKDLYANLITDELWLIKEPKWRKSLQNIRETQFTLGNGYLGTRGVLEEIPYDALPGTFIAGIYDRIGSQVAELVNLPNPLNFRFTVAGEKLDLIAMDSLEHKRILNLKKAVLLRYTLYRDSKKRRYHYQSLRFISRANKNIGVMQIALTPLDAACTLDINTGIDTAVFNIGTITEGRKKHFRIKELGQSQNAGYLLIETLEKKFNIAYWSGFYYETEGEKTYAKENIFRLKIKKNQTVVFTKIFCIKHFPSNKENFFCKKETFKIFSRAFRSDFSTLLNEHIKEWRKIWKKADIVIEETASIQQNLRFIIYHMLIAGNYDGGFSSIGARTLSGEGYRGHIFWDTDIFLLPFYLFNFPRMAKNILLYRYKRLDKARYLAHQDGYRGAKFPWESADTGEEETPGWARDLDGRIIKIYTHKMEQHITADIAYAVYKYYLVTRDEKFMADYGYEIFFEAARFWASRLEKNKRTKKYEIRNVMGPDEFHKNVNNNVYTNMMAKWNLLIAHKLFNRVRKKPSLYKKLKEKIDLNEEEVRDWKKMAPRIKVNIRKDKVLEQFDGYFKLKNIPITRTDENGIPILPSKIKIQNLHKTQLIKQADCLMLIVLLNDVFSFKTKLANYKFYIKRTLHKSSLSAPVHARLACEVNDLNRAYDLFNFSLHIDIGNLYGNTKEGIHAAALGGCWETVISGFAGVRIIKDILVINPQMPRNWKRMIFSLYWQEFLIKLEITNESIKIKATSARKKSLKIRIFDKISTLRTNRLYTFKRTEKETKGKEYFY